MKNQKDDAFHDVQDALDGFVVTLFSLVGVESGFFLCIQL